MSAAASDDSAATFWTAPQKEDEEMNAEHQEMLVRTVKVRRPKTTSAPWHGVAGVAPDLGPAAGAAGGGTQQVMHVRIHPPPPR